MSKKFSLMIDQFLVKKDASPGHWWDFPEKLDNDERK